MPGSDKQTWNPTREDRTVFFHPAHACQRHRLAAVFSNSWGLLVCLLALNIAARPALQAGELTVQLDNAENVILVGAFNRWDQDGNPRVPVNPKAKIDSPRCSATARPAGSERWVFSELPAGTYDLLIMLEGRVRIEGFHYPPVLEFDEFLKHGDTVDPDVQATITSDIAQSRYYENKVTPLHMSGNEKIVRVFVQLLRDDPTSYDAQYGEPVATLRHEVWQYTNRYGAWTKEKRTRVFDRVLMGKQALRQWTWVWVPQLGGIDVGQDELTVRYKIPRRWMESDARGLLPY